MTAYPDTSFLCAIYREQDHSPAADAWLEANPGPLPATALLEFEFLQSIELQVWLHGQDRTKGFGRREAALMRRDWEQDLATGAVKLMPCELSDVLRFAARLSEQHTAGGGHRTLDVLHVATAVHLGLREFLTFDRRQRALAKAAGLKVAV